MQDIWYSDKRDLFKWGSLVQLATEERISHILQIAFLRFAERPQFSRGDLPICVPDKVWDHFRNPTRVCSLGKHLNLRIEIVEEVFTSKSRSQYVANVVHRLSQTPRPKIAFLDPDTGISYTDATSKHVTSKEVTAIWHSLAANDWLVLYQHAWHTKNWIDRTEAVLSAACGCPSTVVFKGWKVANDVVLFGVKKPS